MKVIMGVNKMELKEYDYIRGNTALAPERKVKKQGEKRNIQKKQRKAQQARRNIIINGLTVSSIVFLLCTMTLYLDGKIHDSQKQLLILEQNLKEEEDVNAAINVDMLKFASFESTISIDMSKEYFSHIKQEESAKGGLLQKIMAAFN